MVMISAYRASRSCLGRTVLLFSLLGVMGVEAAPSFRRGDVNADAVINITDPLRTLGTLFLGEATLSCRDAADVDDNGLVDVSDATALINYLFLGGAVPASPGPTECGPDLTPDALECAVYLPEEEGLRCPAAVEFDALLATGLIRVDRQPEVVKLGDLDGDGHLDGVVVSNRFTPNDWRVAVLLGNEEGKLTTAQEYGGPRPYMYSAALGDLDGNGTLDILLAGDSSSLSVLRGAGDGTFRLERESAQLDDPFRVRTADIADVDGDGVLDAVLVSYRPEDRLTVRPGRGDGTFLDPLVRKLSEFPRDLALGDLDGDGFSDVVAAGSRLEIFLGQSGGSLLGPTTLLGESNHGSPVTVGDFDSDGRPDIAAGDRRSGPNTDFATWLAVFRGLGDAEFAEPELLPRLNGDAESLTAIDATGDGHLDLVARRRASALAIFPGSEVGTFGSLLPVHGASGFSSFGGTEAFGDLDSDGHLDIVGAGGFFLSVLFGTGEGRFTGTQHYEIEGGSNALAVANLNADGQPDIVAAPTRYGAESARLVLFHGENGNTFSAPDSFGPKGKYYDMTLADFNADGTPDIAAAHYGEERVGNGQVDVTLRFANGSSATRTQYRTRDHVRTVAVTDVDGDGAPDLGVGSSVIEVLRGLGGGKFEDAREFDRQHPVKGRLVELIAGDFDGNGLGDFIALESDGNVASVRTLRGRGAGFLAAGPSQSQGVGSSARDLVTTDIDRDGILDLVVLLGSTNGTLSIFRILMGRGDGTFTTGASRQTGIDPQSVAAADMDGDGAPDIIVSNTEREVLLFQNRGDGRFENAARYAGSRGEVVLADLDLDGDPDVLQTTRAGVGILFNQK